MKINWTKSARLITILLISLAPSCLWADLYMWTDEDGNPVVSIEKPPDHITDFQTIGQQSDPPQELDQELWDSPQHSETASQYDDIPALILEKIKRTARKRWPDSEQAQEAMIQRQAKACRYVKNAPNLNFPVPVFDLIMVDIERKWPDDYEQQAAYIEKQYHAYQAVLSYENLDLSSAEIDSIKEKAAEKWPFNYVKQERSLRREVEYRIEQIEAKEPEDNVSGLRTYKIGRTE